MDVKCERCGTEYEFDDARVTEAGVNVKCTHCGHLFKVARRSASDAPDTVQMPLDVADEPGGSMPSTRGGQWMIRRADGEVLHFKDLSTLQKWIIERKVSRDDQISKTGQSWKPLGSIVELSSFFLVVDGAEPMVAPTPQPTPGAARRTGPVRSSPIPAAPPPPPRGRDDLLDTGEFRLEGPTSVSQPLPMRTPPPAAASMPSTPAPMGAGSPRASWQGRMGVPPPPPTPMPEPQAPMYPRGATPAPLPPQMTPFGIDIGGPPPAPQRSGNTARGFVFGVLATGALLFVAYFVFDLMARSRTTASSPARETAANRTTQPSARPSPSASLVVKLDRADVEYARDTDAGFERADAEYVSALDALGEPPSDAVLAARALLGRARVAVARADYLRTEAREVPPQRQQAPVDGRDAAAQLVRAEQFLASARELAPTNVDVDLVFADYFRVMGERASAMRYVAKLQPDAEGRPELALLRAALPLEEPSADAADAARRLGELAADAVDLPRARYLRAVALRRAGKSEEAASLLVELVASVPDHGPGKRLLTEISGKMSPSPASQDAVKVASAEAVAVPVVEARPAEPPRREEPRPRVEARPPEPERPAPPARPQPGQDYDALMMQGYRLLESGRSRDARAFFEEAATRKDRSPEPYANIGWCFMDQREYTTAVSFFRRSLERSPRYADALYGLAEAHERAGQTTQAVEAYRHYLEVHPNGRKAEMAQRKIDRLR